MHEGVHSCMLWYFRLLSSETKPSDGTLSSPTGGYCCHPARVCGIASVCDQQTRDCETWSLSNAVLSLSSACVTERNKERKSAAHSLQTSITSILRQTQQQQHCMKLVQRRCVLCVSRCRLKLCLSDRVKQHTHTLLMILCLLSESCTACQSRPPTSALLRDRLGISHPFCLLQRGLQFFGGIRTVMEYVSDFGCSGTLRRETVRIKADKIWTGHSCVSMRWKFEWNTQTQWSLQGKDKHSAILVYSSRKVFNGERILSIASPAFLQLLGSRGWPLRWPLLEPGIKRMCTRDRNCPGEI